MFLGALDDFCKSADKSEKAESSESPQKSAPQKTVPASSKLSANEIPFNDENAAFRLFDSDPELKECFTNLMKTCNEEGIFALFIFSLRLLKFF